MTPFLAHAQERVPEFAVVSLDDSTALITPHALAGKIVLIDFWASWCPPCVEEIPVLTTAFDRYREKGFTILSLSFDKDPDQVRRFRGKRFSMPWMHGHVERGFGSYLAQAFGVEHIPRQVLVDRSGRIVAVDDALRGTRLLETLERILN